VATRLSESEQATVTRAVEAAELTTSGEIVTVLADRSDGYSDVALVYAAAVAFTVMSVFAALPQPILNLWDQLLGLWGHQWSAGEIASMTIALGLLAFTLATLLLSLDAVRFALMPGPVKTARVHDAAVRHFKVGAERRTHGRTGVLIYISMREHRAEIFADQSIAAKVPAEVWGDAMADMLTEIRQGRVGEAFAAGVRDVAAILAEHFPRAADDKNELPDRLIHL
jgi:putative membrane protein